MDAPQNIPPPTTPYLALDKTDKLFERVVAIRLIRYLGELGPNLYNNQFGFREGRSTIDAIKRVKALSEEAVAQSEVTVSMSLYIANAFKTFASALGR